MRERGRERELASEAAERERASEQEAQDAGGELLLLLLLQSEAASLSACGPDAIIGCWRSA